MEMTRFNIVDFNDIIYLEENEIVLNNACGYGIFYLKVSTKKFWKKWSRRMFFISKKGMKFWKSKGEKRKKCEIINFSSSNIFLSGLENVIGNNHKCYLTFKIILNLNMYKQKVYIFKSTNIKMFNELYKLLDKHING
jgi:hypothetical protein